MLVLRPYQEDGINQLRNKLKDGKKRLILWAATAAGKGAMMAYIANSGKKVLVVMRRKDLVRQTHKIFKKYINHNSSIIMAGDKRFNGNNKIQICSIDTIGSRINKEEIQFLREYEIIIVDECHDTGSDRYKKFFDWIGDKIYIGFTATPFEVSGKPLPFWQDYVFPISIKELINQGFLSKYKIYGVSKIDTSGIKIVAGDYSLKELEEKASGTKIVGDIVEAYREHGKNLPAILFAVSVAHSKLLAKSFRDSGIPAIHIDADSTQEERDLAISGLVGGIYKVLCNVNIFSTGVDIPEACVGIMARPTKSEPLYIQQIGRLLRISPGKEYAIILDHACNTYEHGFPDDDREPRLEALGHKKRKKSNNTTPVKSCNSCFGVVGISVKQCPYCGKDFEIKERELINVDAKLVEIINNENFKIDRMKKDYKDWQTAAHIYGWKPHAVNFKMFEKYGNEIFKHFPEIPRWIESVSNKNKEGKLNGAKVRDKFN